MSLPASLFSRILTVVGVLAVLISSYWFITSSLAPYPVPPTPPNRTSVTFDPKVDVSKDKVFSSLRPLSGLEVEVGQTGRSNPFTPPVNAPIIISPVTTTEATTTLPVIITPTSTGPGDMNTPQAPLIDQVEAPSNSVPMP
ncbi:hypothetical protein IT408_02910 [Candidatus Uhrbacteria bacterium]|nr:hypothetical protein [Candidatus Uhrbacteria bacterium]